MSKAKAIIAPVRARLLNLYITGREVVFEDEQGEFSVWLQKINSWQEREAINQSKVVRAPIVALKRDKLNPDRLNYYELLSDWGIDNKDAQIAFLISPKVQQARESAEARIAFEDEWSKDDYLTTLQQSWVNGLAEKYALDPEDKDCLRVRGELERYTELVEAAVDYEAKEYTLDLQEKDEAVIESQVLDLLIDAEADSLQIAEFRKWQIFYATRDVDDHEQLFFDSKQDVDALDPKVYDKLLENYIDLSIDGIEGKD